MKQFIRKVESLIDPDEYSFIYVIQKLKKLLPRRVFKKLLINTSRKTPENGICHRTLFLIPFLQAQEY